MVTVTDEIRLIIAAQTAQFDAAMKRVDNSLDKVERNTVTANRRLKQLITTFASTAAITAFSRSLVDAGSKMQSLQARLEATTNSLDEANEAMNFIVSTAKEQNIEILSLADGYTRLLPAVNTGKISMEEMREILRLTNDNIKAFGGSAQEAAGVFLGLSQTLTSGTVTMEDLRQVTDRMPGSFDRIASAMGITSGELRDLVSTGKLTTDLIKGSLTEALRVNEGAAAKLSDTYESAQTRMANAFLELGASSGAVDLATDAMSRFAELLESETFDKILQVLVISVAGIGDAFSIAADAIGTAVDTIAVKLGVLDEAVINSVSQGTGINQWVDKTKADIDGLGDVFVEETEKVKQALIDPELQALIDGLTGGDDEKAQEKLQERFERFKESLMTERELELLNYENRLQDLIEFHESKLVTEAEFNKLAAEEFARHQNELAEIQERTASRVEGLTGKVYKNETDAVLGELTRLTSGAAQHNKTLFNLNKAAAIAQIALNLPETISDAYKWGTKLGGPPLGAAFAAVAGAAQLVQMNAVRSASFGGGGGGSAPSVAATTPAPAVSDVGTVAGGEQPGRTLNVRLVGNTFTGEDVLSLLNDVLEDGANLNVSNA